MELMVQSRTGEEFEIACMIMLESPFRIIFSRRLFTSLMAIKVAVAFPRFGFTLLMKFVFAKMISPESFQYKDATVFSYCHIKHDEMITTRVPFFIHSNLIILYGPRS